MIWGAVVDGDEGEVGPASGRVVEEGGDVGEGSVFVEEGEIGRAVKTSESDDLVEVVLIPDARPESLGRG